MANNPSYTNYSLYFQTPIDSQGRLSYWVPRPIPFSTSDKVVTISQVYQYRPDLMANDLYGDARLWWIFAQRNPNALAADPIGNFEAGLQIFLPDVANLKNLLGI